MLHAVCTLFLTAALSAAPTDFDPTGLRAPVPSLDGTKVHHPGLALLGVLAPDTQDKPAAASRPSVGTAAPLPPGLPASSGGQRPPGAPAPEPAAFLLVGTGLLGIALTRRWRRQRAV